LQNYKRPRYQQPGLEAVAAARTAARSAGALFLVAFAGALDAGAVPFIDCPVK